MPHGVILQYFIGLEDLICFFDYGVRNIDERNVCSDTAELSYDIVVTALDIFNITYLCFALCRKSGNNKRRTAAKVNGFYRCSGKMYRTPLQAAR